MDETKNCLHLATLLRLCIIDHSKEYHEPLHARDDSNMTVAFICLLNFYVFQNFIMVSGIIFDLNIRKSKHSCCKLQKIT